MRRIVTAVAALVLAVGIGVVFGQIGAETGFDEPRDTFVEPITVLTPSTTFATLPIMATSTTVADAPPTTAAPVLPRPIDVPTNPYFDEPVRTIGSIEIPRIGLRSTMGEGISLHNIDNGPSHWPGSALPGEPGNVVVAGHRVTHSKPFRDIDDLVPGDEVFMEAGSGRFRYVVTTSQVVSPSQTEIAIQTPEPTATLLACHPPGSARYRYVVHLKLAPV